MNARFLAETIEGYLTRPIDADKISGYYAVKGKILDFTDLVDDENCTELLEVGTDYRPILQIRLEEEPRLENTKKTYLGRDDFSGTAYRLTDREFFNIRRTLEKIDQ